MIHEVFDSRACALGEGPLWHPLRHQLFWFDIIEKRLLTQNNGVSQHWQFDEHVSAAGWVDHDTLLIASQTALLRFDITTGESIKVIGLEADQPLTRSNDGRADPWGGFWIGTVGLKGEPGAGTIYRYYGRALRELYTEITIPNAICFSPDKRFAYFTDTPTQTIMRQTLDIEGWPAGAPEMFVDFTSQGLDPDGAVVDTDGNLWVAQWGAGRISQYAADGAFMSAIELPASQITCPAFGGAERTMLFATSAAYDVNEPSSGQTFAIQTTSRGQQEHQVIL